MSAICAEIWSHIHGPKSSVPKRNVSGEGIMRMVRLMATVLPMDGDSPEISAVLPWYASPVTMTPSPPV